MHFWCWETLVETKYWFWILAIVTSGEVWFWTFFAAPTFPSFKMKSKWKSYFSLDFIETPFTCIKTVLVMGNVGGEFLLTFNAGTNVFPVKIKNKGLQQSGFYLTPFTIENYRSYLILSPEKDLFLNISLIRYQISGIQILDVDCTRNPKLRFPSYRILRDLPYPINTARNIARAGARTKYILHSDIKLTPSPNLADNFINFSKKVDKKNEGKPTNGEKTVYVIPVFWARIWSWKSKKQERTFGSSSPRQGSLFSQIHLQTLPFLSETEWLAKDFSEI